MRGLKNPTTDKACLCDGMLLFGYISPFLYGLLFGCQDSRECQAVAS